MMALGPLSLLFALVVSLCVGHCDGWWLVRKPICNPFPQLSDYERCNTCDHFSPRQVTLRVWNPLKEPTFDQSITLQCTRAKTLFYILQEAAKTNSVFRFSCKYFNEQLGFFVEGINGVFGNYNVDKTYWSIYNSSFKSLSVGISLYRPKAGETIIFKLIKDGNEEKTST